MPWHVPGGGRQRRDPTPACDAAGSASRSFRSSAVRAASAVGLTCERAVRGARVSYGDADGTHALVAEAREHLERRATLGPQPAGRSFLARLRGG